MLKCSGQMRVSPAQFLEITSILKCSGQTPWGNESEPRALPRDFFHPRYRICWNCSDSAHWDGHFSWPLLCRFLGGPVSSTSIGNELALSASSQYKMVPRWPYCTATSRTDVTLVIRKKTMPSLIMWLKRGTLPMRGNLRKSSSTFCGTSMTY